MFFPTNELMLYSLIPAGASLLGGLLAYLFSPRPLLMTLLFSLAAGFLLSALVTEFLPFLLASEQRGRLVLSFLIGAAIMLILDLLFFQLEKFSTFSTVIALALALLMNGIILAIAFVASQMTAFVMALGVSLSILLLVFIVMNRVREKGWKRGMRLLTLLFIILMFPLGSWLGSYLLESTPRFARLELLAFGFSIYLYFGIKELICEGHTRKECWFTLAGFFGGLVVPYLLR